MSQDGPFNDPVQSARLVYQRGRPILEADAAAKTWPAAVRILSGRSTHSPASPDDCAGRKAACCQRQIGSSGAPPSSLTPALIVTASAPKG